MSSQPQPPALRVLRLAQNAAVPRYQTAGAAGLDLAACLEHTLVVAPRQIVLVPTGIALAIPPGFEGQVRARSGLSTKYGLTTVNGVGTIDSDYRGEIKVGLINLGPEPVEITPGLRVAQLVIAPIAHCEVVEVRELDATDRGAGGFGSTGRS